MAGTRYVGYAEETELGTWVAPTKYSDIIAESIVPNLRLQFPETSRARAATKTLSGMPIQSGDINFICAPENLTPYACKWNMGAPTTTLVETGAYQHVFVPKDTIKSFSCELGVESATRKVAGSLIDVLTVEGIVGRPIVLTAAIHGKEETKGTIGTPTYSTVADFNFTDAKISIEGAQKDYVRAFRLRLNNNIPIDELFTVGYTGFQSIEVGQHLADGSLDLLFPDTTEYDRFLAATDFAVQLKAEGALVGATAKYTFQIDIPKAIYLSDTAPHIDRQTPFRLTAPFRAIWSTSDSCDAKITIINALSTI